MGCDFTGRRFGDLVVTGRAPNTKHASRWTVRCVCGVVKVLESGNMQRAKSCGCKRFHVTHGDSRRGRMTSLYTVWGAMIQRCNNHKNWAYRYYGGRGISVCDEWLEFIAFKRDMGERPSPLYSLDRINNDGNYCKQNCRWATKAEQSLNRRNGRISEIRSRAGNPQSVVAHIESCLGRRLNSDEVMVADLAGSFVYTGH